MKNILLFTAFLLSSCATRTQDPFDAGLAAAMVQMITQPQPGSQTREVQP